MTYEEKQVERLISSTKRFWEIWAMRPTPKPILAEEGAIMIESLIAIAGPEVMLCYTRTLQQHSMIANGLCPWDHKDDRLLHRVSGQGMCAECLAGGSDR